MTKPPTRLPSETTTITLGGGHTIEMSKVIDPRTGEVCEMVYQSAGKIGSGVDLLVQELGMKTSRFIQSRDPETGETTP